MADQVLRLDGVVKRFSGHTAVRNLSMSVPAGGIFGLLGPNGAGKTTTIRMIMNIQTPDEGSITLFGEPASRAHSDRIGFLPEERGLYRKMEVLEHLAFLGETKGLRRRDAQARSRKWLERLGLGDWTGRRIEDLSKGMQQKVQFIGTLLHDPELIVLDEPFSGLDPVNSKVMKDVVVELGDLLDLLFGQIRQRVVLVHDDRDAVVRDLDAVARGEKVVDGAVADVKRDAGARHVRLTFTRNRESARRVLHDRALVLHAENHGASAEVELAPGADGEQLLRALVTADVGLSEFAVVEPSLESIFIAKVGPAAATAVAEVAHA